MALFVMQHVLADSYPGGASLLAGMAVHLDSTGTVVAANRSTAAHRCFGIVGDDTTNSGNTQFVVDPVNYNNYSHDTTTGDDPDDYTGPEAVARPTRRLADYLDERITNTVNWTDSPASAKRNVTVYHVGGRFRTDQYETAYIPSSATADTAGTPSYTPGETLVFSATTAGKWIPTTSVAAADDNCGLCARVTKGATGGAIELVLLQTAGTLV